MAAETRVIAGHLKLSRRKVCASGVMSQPETSPAAASLIRAGMLLLPLMLLTLGLVAWSGREEPFYGPPRLAQAWLSLGLSSLLALCWLAWAGLWLRRLMKGEVAWPASALLLVAAMSLGLLWLVANGYVADQRTSFKMLDKSGGADSSPNLSD